MRVRVQACRWRVEISGDDGIRLVDTGPTAAGSSRRTLSSSAW
jgi:hypothetical protein